MRFLTFMFLLFSFANFSTAAERPGIEKFFSAGELAKGEQTLERFLLANPKDDQTRFGLGVLQFVRSIERFGQSLYEYGCKAENSRVPFLRLPIPENPEPAPIIYTAFRRIFDDLLRHLEIAEGTLANITDEKVQLPVRLANIRLDLDGDGKATDRFVDLLKKIMQQNRFEFLQDNPDFLVCFDRGDVAWLRAYCHLLMAMIDGYLAFDAEQNFDAFAPTMFAKVRLSKRAKNQPEGIAFGTEWVVKEPARLGRFRKHLLQVAALNRETWKFIRAETDDHYEWLPNARQKGVLGLPVRDDMIDNWLSMIAELEAALEGKKTLPSLFYWDRNGKGLNFKELLDNPPEKLNLSAFPNELADRYFTKSPEIDITVLFRVAQMFNDTTSFAYAAWFN